MKKRSSINALSFSGGLLKTYLEGNGIKGAFVWREGPREWEVLEGNPEEKTGFHAATFTTRREANALRDKINEHIRLFLLQNADWNRSNAELAETIKPNF